MRDLIYERPQLKLMLNFLLNLHSQPKDTERLHSLTKSPFSINFHYVEESS